MSFTADALRRLFRLEPGGHLVWLLPSKYHRDLVGREAGSPIPGHSGKTYWAVQIAGKKFKRSHLVFCMTRGRWPEKQIDHIDGNSLNDHPANLREATVMQNAWNHKGRAKKSPLPMGVRKTTRGKFVARIRVAHRPISLGAFATASEAERVYLAARRQYFGEFA